MILKCRSIDRFSYVLSSEYVDVRLESGQSLAIIYEIGRTHSVDFGQAALDDLLPIVNDLAKVSHKHRGKKEQKTQRITFRIIEDFLEVFENIFFFERVVLSLLSL